MEFYETLDLSIFKDTPEINNDEYKDVDFNQLNLTLKMFKDNCKNWEYLICLYNFKSALFHRLILKLIHKKYGYEDITDTFYLTKDKESKIVPIVDLYEYIKNGLIGLVNKILEPKSKELCNNLIQIFKVLDFSEYLNKIKYYLYDSINLISKSEVKENKVNNDINLELFDNTHLQATESKNIECFYLYTLYEEWCLSKRYFSCKYYDFEVYMKEKHKFIEKDYDIYLYVKYNK